MPSRSGHQRVRRCRARAARGTQNRAFLARNLNMKRACAARPRAPRDRAFLAEAASQDGEHEWAGARGARWPGGGPATLGLFRPPSQLPVRRTPRRLTLCNCAPRQAAMPVKSQAVRPSKCSFTCSFILHFTLTQSRSRSQPVAERCRRWEGRASVPDGRPPPALQRASSRCLHRRRRLRRLRRWHIALQQRGAQRRKKQLLAASRRGQVLGLERGDAIGRRRRGG